MAVAAGLALAAVLACLAPLLCFRIGNGRCPIIGQKLFPPGKQSKGGRQHCPGRLAPAPKRPPGGGRLGPAGASRAALKG
jgi:hypothetical protein